MKRGRGFNFEDELASIAPLMLREVTKRMEVTFSKVHLAITHIVILDLLREKGVCNMGDLAESLNLTMSAVTGIVDKMVELGLVKRVHSEEDRRNVNLTLVKKGLDVAHRVNQGRRMIIGNIYSVLTEKEKQVYVKLLLKVYEGLKKK